MEVLLIRRGGSICNTAKFLNNFVSDKRKAVILSSSHQEAIKSAEIMKGRLNFRMRKVGWIRLNKTGNNGSPDHKIKSEMTLYSIKHKDIKTFIIIGNETEIKHILDTYAENFMLHTKVFDTTVEKASVHRVDTMKREIKKIFPRT